MEKKRNDCFFLNRIALYKYVMLCYVIYKTFTAEQKQQLPTPTYWARKEKEHDKKTVTPSPATSTPNLVDPKDCKLIGWVEGGWLLEQNPAGKKKLPEDSPKAGKGKSQQANL